ncbi:MAG: hypothetical protein IIZ68_01905 [Clostridia bacterium]|nr:hypothetical protein [Clostridia bacterium]
MKKRKKKVSRADRYMIYSAFAAAAGIMILSASAVVSVHAYLSAQTDVKNNPFSPWQYTFTDISISEPHGHNYVFATSGTSPGKFVTSDSAKTAEVKVTSGQDKKPVFIRATIVMEIYDSNGVNIMRKYTTPCAPGYNVEPTFDIDTTNWTAKSGGAGTYYYYNKIVLPGETAPDLLKGTGVTISHPEVLPDGATVSVRVITDAVQAVSIDDQDWTAADYTAENVTTAWGITPTPTFTVLAPTTQESNVTVTW